MYLETRRSPLVPCLLWLFLLFLGSAYAAELSGKVRALSGEPLPARILIRQPQTKASVVLYTTPQGYFQASVPEGPLEVLATHGPEWTIAERTAQGGEHIELILQRLVDMPARGYYGADLHLHSTQSDGQQSPAEVAFACQAEGLHIAALTDHDTIAHQEAWLAQQTPYFLPLRGQEVTTKLGHILSLNCAQFISPALEKALDFIGLFAAIHQHGGLAIVAHPCALPMGYQAPEIRDYDAWEILNGSLPPYGPPFDFLQARKAWHNQLSQGHRLPVVGNSDNHDIFSSLARRLLQNPEEAQKADKHLALLMRMTNVEKTLLPWAWKGLHPGFYRTYLQLSELTPQAVQEAVKQGRGFVTNGPLMLATLAGQPPGSEIALQGRDSLPLQIELWANRPLERLLVLVNGQQAISVQSNAARLEMSVPARPGDWIVAELYGVWPEFATTNAWHVK